MITMRFLQHLALTSRNFWANETGNVTGLNRILTAIAKKTTLMRYFQIYADISSNLGSKVI